MKKKYFVNNWFCSVSWQKSVTPEVILQPSANLFQKVPSVKKSLYLKETVLLISQRKPNLSELRCDPSTMRCNRSIVDAYSFIVDPSLQSTMKMASPY